MSNKGNTFESKILFFWLIFVFLVTSYINFFTSPINEIYYIYETILNIFVIIYRFNSARRGFSY